MRPGGRRRYPNTFASHGRTKTAVTYTTIGTTPITMKTPRLADVGLLFSSIWMRTIASSLPFATVLKTQGQWFRRAPRRNRLLRISSRMVSVPVSELTKAGRDLLPLENQHLITSTEHSTIGRHLSVGLAGSVRSLTIDPRDPTELYAGTSGGLFVINVGPSRSSQTGTQKLSR